MSQFIHKSHNVTILLYHLVFPAKYRRAVIDKDVDVELKNTCLEIEKRYEIKFLEIGMDKDHVHVLVQSVPNYSVIKIVTMIKSVSAREIFKKCPQVKNQLWGEEFWSDGYFASSVEKHGDEVMIVKYVKNQGGEYQELQKDHQPTHCLRRGCLFQPKIVNGAVELAELQKFNEGQSDILDPVGNGVGVPPVLTAEDSRKLHRLEIRPT